MSLALSPLTNPLHLPHQQPESQAETRPTASTKKPSWAIIGSFMPGLELDWEYRHSRPQREAPPHYVEIREDVSHHCEIKAALQAMGYERAWQQKQWHV